uniref:Uncharacterized protein n=1 Tax=Candidatus Kentrum sp. FM TaxID=2126340 RepID=A0A450SEC8_9GAMM|nr:MAG: hypothetical protein BECKFM1743C_GA0114222_100934 [Candidatus Kentron sp. FM]
MSAFSLPNFMTYGASGRIFLLGEGCIEQAKELAAPCRVE